MIATTETVGSLVGEVFHEHRRPSATHHAVCVVYKATNQRNGKIYVGSAKRFYRRFRAYRGLRTRPPSAKSAFEKAIVKWGFGAFTFEIIETPAAEEQFTREQYWIDTLQPFREAGYNVATSVRHIPDKCQKPISEERRTKMRERSRRTALKYREQTRQRSSRAVLQIDRDSGAIIREFSSALDADKHMGLSLNTVNRVARGDRSNRTAGGFAWAYKDDYEAGRFALPARRKIALCASYYLDIKPIVMTDEHGNSTIWDCPLDIRNALGFCETPILKCCRGERQKSHGFRWSFVTDPETLSAIRTRRKAHYEANRFAYLEVPNGSV